MLQLFRSKKGTQKLIAKIHHEFNSAGDAALMEARAILGINAWQGQDKPGRLARLGFISSVEVEKWNGLHMTKEMADAIDAYKVKYPFYRFITERQIEVICRKYGLVFGHAQMYKGFVPEEKLTQMENFKLLECDKHCLTTTDGLEFLNAEVRPAMGHWFIFKANDKSSNQYAFQSNNGEDFYASDSKNLFGLMHKGNLHFTIRKEGFLICAPRKDMHLRPDQKIVGNKIINIPYPVVLQPVRYGYLIVAAWGDEAADPIVVNSIGN